MRIIADLHIHSRFSRATSPRLNPACLDRWAQIKGIGLLGSGDATHPRWLAELRETLDDAEEGLYVLKEGIRAAFDRGPAMEEGIPRAGGGADSGEPVRFVLTGEISTIYKRGDKTRKIHHLILLPDFKAAAAFQIRLERVGNISSDGRPILGIDSRDLLSMLLDTDNRALLIPAHIWTPWFSALGAKSGFDSIEECYGDLAPYIPAVETGLSSNPPMNWALSSLDKFSIVSNSDAHSPDKLGREATIFAMELSYPALSAALWRGGKEGGILETVEFFPQEGKYHYDGHRKCGRWLGPAEAAAVGGICPVCGKPLTRGVMGRVMELADRPVDETQAAPVDINGGNRRPYRSLIPLREILGELLETGPASKKVDGLYGFLIEKAGTELSLLIDAPIPEIERLKAPGISGELMARAFERMRSGRVSISPGYDGEYGLIRAFAPGERPEAKSEKGLFGDEPVGGPVSRAESAESRFRISTRAEVPAIELLPSSTDAASPVSGPASFALNGEQEQAVSYAGKQAIIIAGPGTGKTAVLAARIARLVKEGTDPRSILAVSFTVKAAAELGERIAAAIGIKEAGFKPLFPKSLSKPAGFWERFNALTFHSFCYSLLREQAGKNGIPKDFRIIGEGERYEILREICDRERNVAGNRKRTGYQKLGKYIEGRKRFLLFPGEVTPGFGGPGFEALTRLAEELGLPETLPEEERLYGIYRDRLRASALMDFDGLVAGAVRFLSGNPEQLFSYRNRFRFIFVDEYQDLNFAQYALLRLLTADAFFSSGDIPSEREAPSLWVIGDPNQAIYGFRGSDKRFISRFPADYPRTGELHLTQSFRCPVPIINAAGRLMDTQLRGTWGEAALFRGEYPTEKAEAEGIARRISRLIGGASFFAIDSETADNGVMEGAASDNAILIRSAALAPPIIKALRDHGIPFELIGEKPWWEEEPALTLLGFLRKNPQLPGEDKRQASGSTLKALSSAEAVRAAWRLLSQDGVPAFGGKQEKPEILERLISLASMYDSLPAFLDSLAICGSGDIPEIRREGVRVMTIHASKGLEFDHVFIAALEEGLLPFTLYGDSAAPAAEGNGGTAEREHIEEERRLLYVAMTRARRGLYLSWSRQRTFHGRKLEGGPSRFLKELETSIPLAQDYLPRPRDPQMTLF
jgi:uncharacterized protein (TIGR00375 family)